MKLDASLPNRWPLWPPLLCLMLVCGNLHSGCRPAAKSEPSPVSKREQSWEEQIAGIVQGDSSQVVLLKEPVSSEQFQQLEACLEQLEHLELGQAEFTEADWELLSRMKKLYWLRLDFPVDDEGLAWIAKLPSLQILNLRRGTFTDAGIEHLRPLKQLELLRFHSPHVTDASLAVIATLPALRYLHLIDLNITDEGLQELHGVSQLESFYVDGGKTTDAGLLKLLKAIPGLHLHKDQLHLPGDPHAHDHGSRKP